MKKFIFKFCLEIIGNRRVKQVNTPEDKNSNKVANLMMCYIKSEKPLLCSRWLGINTIGINIKVLLEKYIIHYPTLLCQLYGNLGKKIIYNLGSLYLLSFLIIKRLIPVIKLVNEIRSSSVI